MGQCIEGEEGGVAMQGIFVFRAEEGIRDLVRSRGLGDEYKREVVVLDLDLFSGGVTLTAAAAAAGQVMYIAVNAIADHSGQNQYNNNICHRYTSSKLALANSVFRIH